VLQVREDARLVSAAGHQWKADGGITAAKPRRPSHSDGKGAVLDVIRCPAVIAIVLGEQSEGVIAHSVVPTRRRRSRAR